MGFVQQGKSLERSLRLAFELHFLGWSFFCDCDLSVCLGLQDPPLYLALELQCCPPVQRLVLTRPQRLDRVKVPASPTPQALDPYHLQQHYFLLVLSLFQLLLGQCQAVASLLCLDSSPASLGSALQQPRTPVSEPVQLCCT